MLSQSAHIGCLDCLGRAEQRLKALSIAYAQQGDRATSQKAALLRLELRYISGYFEVGTTDLALEGRYVRRKLTEMIEALAAHARTTFQWLPEGFEAHELAVIGELLRDARGPLAAALDVQVPVCPG